MVITIENNGADLADTNYWSTEHASAGLCYLSANAGDLRLLVPAASQHLLAEMRTGKRITIERSLHPGAPPKAIDVVFEDGSQSPFSISLSPGQIERAITRGKCRLSVWTEQGGKVSNLPCTIRL